MKNRSDTPLQSWLQPYNCQPDGGTPLSGEVTAGGWPCTSMHARCIWPRWWGWRMAGGWRGRWAGVAGRLTKLLGGRLMRTMRTMSSHPALRLARRAALHAGPYPGAPGVTLPAVARTEAVCGARGSAAGVRILCTIAYVWSLNTVRARCVHDVAPPDNPCLRDRILNSGCLTPVTLS